MSLNRSDITAASQDVGEQISVLKAELLKLDQQRTLVVQRLDAFMKFKEASEALLNVTAPSTNAPAISGAQFFTPKA